jgi:hypothetical protein
MLPQRLVNVRFAPEADIRQRIQYVCFVPKAELHEFLVYVVKSFVLALRLSSHAVKHSWIRAAGLLNAL